MKASLSETNLMVLAIIIIGIIAGVITMVVNTSLNTIKTKTDAIGTLGDNPSGSTSDNGGTTAKDYNYVISNNLNNFELKAGKWESLNPGNINGSNETVSTEIRDAVIKESNKVISGIGKESSNVNFSTNNTDVAKITYNKTANSLKKYNLNNAGSKSTKVFNDNNITVSVTTYRDVKGKDVTVTCYYQKENGEYKLMYVSDSLSSGTEKSFSDSLAFEKEGKVKLNSIDSDLAKAFNGQAMTEERIRQIFTDQKDIVAILNTYNNENIVKIGSGFFINKGVIVTTWNYVKNALLLGEKIIVKNAEGKASLVTGIISYNDKLDIAVLKLKEKVGKEAVLKSPNGMKQGAMVLTISSKSGYNLSSQSGVLVSNGKTLKSVLPLSETDEGSPLFDSNGNVIGINTSLSINNDFSVAISAKNIIDIQKRLQTISFDNIKITPLSDFQNKYFYQKCAEENQYNKIDSNVWEEYKIIGDIENTIPLTPVKSSYKDGIISIRYLNKASNYIDSMDVVSAFKSSLLNSNYKQILNSKNKEVYQNNKYKVVITKEMNYLIILLVRM